MVQDIVHNLCESLVENIGGVTGIGKKTPPTPITYLTQWKIVGNSEVHTLPYPDGIVLPTGYKRCEYLESHGTEYIELPFGFDKTDEVSAKAALVDLTRIYDMFFVAPKTWNNNNNRYGLGCHNNFGVAYGSKSTGQTVFLPSKEPDVDVHTYSYANELFILDDGTSSRDVSDATFGSTTDNLRLFHSYNADVKWRIYTYHHTKANNVEVNLIPCLDDNNVPCLYDTVSNTAFYNDGTGTFGYKLYPQPTEIWSCGEYSAVDNKWHIRILPEGYGIVDIALDEPLRKVNDVADNIEFVDGVGTVTRNFASCNLGDFTWVRKTTNSSGLYRYSTPSNVELLPNCKVVDNLGIALCPKYSVIVPSSTYIRYEGIGYYNNNNLANGQIFIYDSNANTLSADDFKDYIQNVELIYQMTPTTETIQVPQIQEADSYTCVISQGGKAVSWSSFETN